MKQISIAGLTVYGTWTRVAYSSTTTQARYLQQGDKVPVQPHQWKPRNYHNNWCNQCCWKGMLLSKGRHDEPLIASRLRMHRRVARGAGLTVVGPNRELHVSGSGTPFCLILEMTDLRYQFWMAMTPTISLSSLTQL